MSRTPDRPAIHRFSAMASPCEIQIMGVGAEEAGHLGRLAETEARRIEAKYSRYRDDSVLSAINRSNGQPVPIDAETRALLDYAAQCHALSGGLFDITSGVLRRAWKFDGSDNVPTAQAVAAIMPFIGWGKIRLEEAAITLAPGMEIDFGGLGKEYAVDRAFLALVAETGAPLLVNFGGDLRVSGPRQAGQPWRIAIEDVNREAAAQAMLEVSGGAIATSGDARRFLLKDGRRYSHILDPRTGWPVVDPPRSVTIAASTCMEAGIFSTLVMAHGPDAEAFVAAEKLNAWVRR